MSINPQPMDPMPLDDEKSERIFSIATSFVVYDSRFKLED